LCASVGAVKKRRWLWRESLGDATVPIHERPYALSGPRAGLGGPAPAALRER